MYPGCIQARQTKIYVYISRLRPKGVIRICISKMNKQYNGQKKKYKRTNNNLQNIHIKLKIE